MKACLSGIACSPLLDVFFVLDEFLDDKLYCALQYCHIIQQGPQADFFDALLPAAVDEAAAEENAYVEQNFDLAVFSSGNQKKILRL